MNGREELNNKVLEHSNNIAKNFPRQLDGYVDNLAMTKQPKTVFQYTEICMYFIKQYMEENNISIEDLDFKKIKERDVNNFFKTVNIKTTKEGDQVRTSASYYRSNWFALNSMFRYLKKNGKIKKNVMEDVVNRKPGRRVKKYNYLKENEIHNLLSIIRKPYNDYFQHKIYPCPRDIRDMVIIELYLQTGMRLSALTQLKMDDIDYENNTIYVIDKGDKVFEHHIPDQLMEHLKFYIEESRYVMINSSVYDTDYLFFSSRTGRSLSRVRIYEIVTHYTELAGNKVSPHKLRSTYALTLYDKTKDAILVQHKMGHSSLNTTMAYINHVSDEKKEMADKVIADLLF